MGHNSPMVIENFTWKMEFQGRGAGHTHGTAWCNLNKISKTLVINIEDDLELNQQNIEDTENVLEKAFKKLRRDDKLKAEEEIALLTTRKKRRYQ